MHDTGALETVLLVKLVRPNRSVTVAVLFHGLPQRVVFLVRVVLLHFLAKRNAIVLQVIGRLGAPERLVVLLILFFFAPVES